eukprot:g28067.t1
MSYFVGCKAVENGITEDAGFAINGGKGWSDVVFENHKIDVSGNVAIALGNYYFTTAVDGSKTKVEYTFGYKKNTDGKVRIFLHHSSVPLGLPATASPDDLKRAYRKLVLQYHPDKNQADEANLRLANQKFREISEAWQSFATIALHLV